MEVKNPRTQPHELDYRDESSLTSSIIAAGGGGPLGWLRSVALNQFELRPLQPRVSPVGTASAVVVDSTLRRHYPIA